MAFAQLIHRSLVNCFLILATFTLLSFMGGYWWGFDRLADGRLQLLACAVLGFVVLLITHLFFKNGLRWIWFAVLLIAVNAQPVISFSLSRASFENSEKSNETLRLMSLNVLTSNRQHQAVIEEIRHHSPDIVLLLEIDDRWMKALSTLQSDYPHHIAYSKHDNFGLLLLSKHPFVKKRVALWGQHQLPYVQAAFLSKSGKPFHLVGTHAFPPMTKEKHWENHHQIEFHLERLDQMDQAAILLGDFNKTPWSHSYRQLVGATSFKNAASGWIPFSTWRQHFFGGLFIDHVMVKNLRPLKHFRINLMHIQRL